MQRAKELFERGRLVEAIQELNQEVKARPAESSLRTFLFELLCFQGDLDRAAKQLDVIAAQSGDAHLELALQGYRALLTAEALRRDVFHGDALPKFLSAPAVHVEAYVMLVKKLREPSEQTADLLEQAEEQTPAIAGTRNGAPFSTFRDADDRLSSVLEVFHAAEYLWVPFDQIERFEVAAPRKLRELMWTPARLQVIGQPMGQVFIPALYVDSHRHSSDAVKLGRTTEWEALHDRIVFGSGQRMFLIDDTEVPLAEVGEVTFAAQSTGAAT